METTHRPPEAQFTIFGFIFHCAYSFALLYTLGVQVRLEKILVHAFQVTVLRLLTACVRMFCGTQIFSIAAMCSTSYMCPSSGGTQLACVGARA